MSMFDDLDGGFEPSPDAALPAVGARVKQIKFRRRAMLAGALGTAALIGVASVAFALPSDRHDGQVQIQTETTTTVAARKHVVDKRKPTTTTTTTLARARAATTTTVGKPRNPVPAPHPAGDLSQLQISISATAIDIVQGNTGTVTFTVHNAGSWTVLPQKSPCEVVYMPENPPCHGTVLSETMLAPGATVAYPVKITAAALPPSGPLTAIDPGDYAVPVLYMKTYNVVAHVTSALTAHISPTSVSVKAGDPLAVTLTVRNMSESNVLYTLHGNSCDPSLVPQPDEVCTMSLYRLPVAPHSTLTKSVNVTTKGAPAGVYHVKIGDQTLTVSVHT